MPSLTRNKLNTVAPSVYLYHWSPLSCYPSRSLSLSHSHSSLFISSSSLLHSLPPTFAFPIQSRHTLLSSFQSNSIAQKPSPVPSHSFTSKCSSSTTTSSTCYSSLSYFLPSSSHPRTRVPFPPSHPTHTTPVNSPSSRTSSRLPIQPLTISTWSRITSTRLSTMPCSCPARRALQAT